MDSENIWKIIHSYFEDNPQSLVTHHIESYNDFFKTGIYQIFKNNGVISLNSGFDEKIGDYRHQCNIYLGGKKADRLYFGKPVIYDDKNSHYMFPNEARLRNMTYAMTIHYDVEVEYINILEPGQAPYEVTADMVGFRNYEEYMVKENYVEENKVEKDANKEKFINKVLTEEELQLLDRELPKNEKKKTGGEEGMESMEGGDKSCPIYLYYGGGPKKTERQKRVKSVEVEMTTGMTTKLRDETEKSVVKANTQVRTHNFERVFLGRFPVMVQSDFCILNKLPREVRFNMGECRNDMGGYFIISGKEKTIISQEKFADNMLYIRKANDDKHVYSAEIKSVSENVSKPIRTLAMRIVAPSRKFTNMQIEVTIPNVRKPVPLFILFRALGVISDKSIITMCLLDLEKYESLLDIFIPSVHDSSIIFTQREALHYIAKLTKYNTVSYAMEILTDYLLPHVGETNYIEKAYYLGYMAFRLISVYSKIEEPTDRDHYKCKRVELVGSLINDLFREYFNLQKKEIHFSFESILYYNKEMYSDNLPLLIKTNLKKAFQERVLELGFKKAFKGNWGAFPHTKRIGVVQDLNRLSFNSALSHLRKTNLPLDATAKVVGPRVLHCSQWGFIDPIDTPDGGNIGLHKTLSIMTYVSRGYSREEMIRWMREKIALKLVEECGPQYLATMTRVLINGFWAGSIEDPISSVNKIKLFRRNGLVPIHTSVTFNIKLNTVFIYTDAGRVCRPIFYVDENGEETSRIPAFAKKEILDKLKKNDFNWNDLVTGFNPKKIEKYKNALPRIYELHELYDGVGKETNPAKLKTFHEKKAIIDYIDPSESENALISVNQTNYIEEKRKHFTHIEIDPSIAYGVMSNQIVFLENNPPVRNSFSCVQTKQAVSVYHTNFNMRMDKAAVVLNYGQSPLLTTRYLEHICHNENPYGENAIVAIMCYTGYNVEDAVLFNEASLKRGIFNTTYYTTYELYEESSKIGNSSVDKRITNIEKEESMIGTKPGYDYSKLDKYGLIEENTLVNDKTVLIGMACNIVDRPGVKMDMSKTPKKGQLGVVDKTFITEGEEGERIAKVRIREVRVPALGDKMASRVGQKGTVGLIIPESDMPFTKDGLRPDIIINPHAIPSRMTIGQLVESIVGKACIVYGGFSDCTPFTNDGSKIGVIGEHLTKVGFHSSGNEVMYNGMTGEQIESSIFIGPTYYMRLKQMVKDKINYRALGPRTALTRQPLSGRANDGGLRIGEMERDVLISHGMTDFLRESMMERGDKYYLAICNTTGMIAVYNPSKNLFMSPGADGPIQFVGSVDGKEMHIQNITKFGRNFSVVCVPYTFKLLMQELQTINMQMRIITEDNISQLENMTFSKNIEKLIHMPDATVLNVINETKNRIAQSENAYRKHVSIDSEEDIFKYPISPDGPPPILGQPKWPYEPMSPEGTPPGYPSTRVPPPPPTEQPKWPYEPMSPEGTPPGYPSTRDRARAPEFYPTSPEGTPPGISRTAEFEYEGGAKSMDEFSIGENVFYRGDIKPNRMWVIIDHGRDFYTIDTEDMEGLTDVQEMRKVVTPRDIYRSNSVVYSSPNEFNMPYMQASNMNMNASMHPGGFYPMNGPGNGGIHVNPVIKIVNGPDNSIGVPTDTGNTEVGAATTENIHNLQSIQHIDSGKKTGVSGSKGIESGANMTGEEDSGTIDFSKGFLIKKV